MKNVLPDCISRKLLVMLALHKEKMVERFLTYWSISAWDFHVYVVDDFRN